MQVETTEQFLARNGEIKKYPVTFDNDHMRFKWANKGNKGDMKAAHEREAAKPKGQMQYGQCYAGRGF